MRAILQKTSEQPSRFGGKFYYAFFKLEDGRSSRSCLSPTCKNFFRWKPFIGKQNVELDGIVLKGNMVDADSYPTEVKNN
jgi:hypothetical protein